MQAAGYGEVEHVAIFDEAQRSWTHKRLLELCDALLALETNDAEYVMGYPDDLKLRSCMTLFQAADPECGTFQEVLDKYFSGRPDEKTLRILKNQENK